MARWAKFFAEEPLKGLCWANFSRLGMRGPVAGRSFSRASSRGGCWARAWRL